MGDLLVHLPGIPEMDVAIPSPSLIFSPLSAACHRSIVTPVVAAVVHHLEGELDHLHPTAGLPMVPLDVVILVVVVETEALVGQVVLEMAAQALVDQVAAAHTLVDQVGQVV